VYLERLFEHPRHVEFQVLGDRNGGPVHLFERDCSVQAPATRKSSREAPAPALERSQVNAVADRIAAIVREIGYDISHGRNAG